MDDDGLDFRRPRPELSRSESTSISHHAPRVQRICPARELGGEKKLPAQQHPFAIMRRTLGQLDQDKSPIYVPYRQRIAYAPGVRIASWPSRVPSPCYSLCLRISRTGMRLK